MKIFNEFMYTIDIFKIPTFIMYKNNYMISTNISKFCSIIFLCYAMYQIYGQLTILIERS